MNIEMVPLQIIGLKKDLHATLRALRRFGRVHIDDLSEVPEVLARPLTLDRETLRLQEELNFSLARVEGMLEALGVKAQAATSTPTTHSLEETRGALEEMVQRVQAIKSLQERLSAEMASLPRYEATLRKLLPIIPASARESGNVSVGILVNRAHIGVLDSVSRQVLEITAGRADIVSGDVDFSTRAMLIVFPAEFSAQVEALLGQEDVSRLSLPEELGLGPPDAILAKLHQRVTAIPEELRKINQELKSLAEEWGEQLIRLREALRDEVENLSVLSRFGETDLTFVLVGWVPAEDFDQVNLVLREAVGEAVFVQRLTMNAEMKKRAPVILKNPAPARPFESLVNMLSIPRYGHIDPTFLMSFFLPLFFGMILGDVGYGFLLLALSLAFGRRYKTGIRHDLAAALVIGSIWSIVFGILYGEFFGDFGERLGMHPLWLDRADKEDILPLLVMTLVVGALHITLGLILGIWEAVKERSRHHLLERGGMFLGLICMFLMVGILTEYLPKGFMTPAVAGLIIGIVLLGAPLGKIGPFIGFIEFIGVIGNVLSYLRIAAIGLASVYLARVANDLAGMMGNLIISAVIAILFHGLNLALGAFSPTIHSLRLHYVEFFRKFYEGGGRPYEPFRSRIS